MIYRVFHIWRITITWTSADFLDPKEETMFQNIKIRTTAFKEFKFNASFKYVGHFV